MADAAYTLIHMMEAERILAGRMLEMASDTFSNHGCNDMPKEMFEGIPPEIRQAMLDRYKEWDGNPDLDDLKFDHIGDWAWMSYFAARLKGGA